MMLSTKKFAEKKGLSRQIVHRYILKSRITAVDLNKSTREKKGKTIRALYRIPESELDKI